MTSDLPVSARLPPLDAVCAPAACSEWVTYILSELWPIVDALLRMCTPPGSSSGR